MADRPDLAAVVMGLTAPGIAVARSLARTGVDVVVVSATADPPAAHSRLFSFRHGPSVARHRLRPRFQAALA